MHYTYNTMYLIYIHYQDTYKEYFVYDENKLYTH